MASGIQFSMHFLSVCVCALKAGGVTVDFLVAQTKPRKSTANSCFLQSPLVGFLDASAIICICSPNAWVLV